MADQQAQNGGADKATTEAESIVAFDLIGVLAVKAPMAREAARYYKEVFGAVELNRLAKLKRRRDRDVPVLQVLLKFSSGKILVVDRFEEELKDQRDCAFQLVSKGDPDTVLRKVVQNGGTSLTSQGLDVIEDLAYSGRNYFGIVKDPFGIVWTIAGNQIVKVTEAGEDNTTAAETGADNTTAAETEADNTTAA